LWGGDSVYNYVNNLLFHTKELHFDKLRSFHDGIRAAFDALPGEVQSSRIRDSQRFSNASKISKEVDFFHHDKKEVKKKILAFVEGLKKELITATTGGKSAKTHPNLIYDKNGLNKVGWAKFARKGGDGWGVFISKMVALNKDIISYLIAAEDLLKIAEERERQVWGGAKQVNHHLNQQGQNNGRRLHPYQQSKQMKKILKNKEAKISLNPFKLLFGRKTKFKRSAFGINHWVTRVRRASKAARKRDKRRQHARKEIKELVAKAKDPKVDVGFKLIKATKNYYSNIAKEITHLARILYAIEVIAYQLNQTSIPKVREEIEILDDTVHSDKKLNILHNKYAELTKLYAGLLEQMRLMTRAEDRGRFQMRLALKTKRNPRKLEKLMKKESRHIADDIEDFFDALEDLHKREKIGGVDKIQKDMVEMIDKVRDILNQLTQIFYNDLAVLHNLKNEIQELDKLVRYDKQLNQATKNQVLAYLQEATKLEEKKIHEARRQARAEAHTQVA